MNSPAPTEPISKKVLWTSRIMVALPVLMMFMSAAFKFLKPPEVVKSFEHLGWSMNVVAILGGLQIACAILYAIPRTAVLGAILLTGYLGGAIATCVRVGDGWILQFVFGVILWGGLFLRDPRLRALIPLVK
jgi:hypothetical protein